ncbi:ribonuclease R [Massilia sp. YIM B02763]|uniref:ribonuclease R n=1 Tax=Massilia sp. YIM B02763 TaxID=3050130 RepID=UPI0025B67D30|nr:ribonuclease R [Massilia sp. YIM B02763]MDN4054972.1 ribonuclease R [Massilia sp. YIM B02763]
MKHPTHTIPSREEILGVFRQAKGPLDSGAVARALQVNPEAEGVLARRLNAMERDGQIRSNPAGQFALTDHSSFIAGRVSAHRDGFGFVIPDEGGDDLFLNDKEMQKVLHGDRVMARVVGTDRRGRAEGTIVEVVERANTHIIGRLLNENGVWVVAPEDKRIGQDILVAGSPGKAKSGQVVSVELVEQPSRFRQPTGKIVEVLGELDDPGMEIEIAVRKFGVPHIFSQAAVKQANKLPNEVRDSDLGERVDLRDVPLVTIDGEDARDFDDAVYCEPVKIGRAKGYRLLVAIADVSHYVKPGDPLDDDAIERSTSVYFPRRVIPMLPEKLSNGLCSLNPAVDRLTLVCDMVVSSEGEVKAYQFYPAVMHSAARLTYNEVAAILGNTKGPEAARRPAIVPHLLNLNEAFRALLKARQQRGAIDFETTETYIVCNAMGKIEKIIPRTRNDAHRLIEECMLAANVCAADFLIRHNQPSTFRIHAVPTEEKLNQLRQFLKLAGLNLGGGTTPQARDYADLMQKIKERPDATLLQTMLLRSMQQAVYSPDNVGHFGLAYEHYAHFTSPIRRYPDLLTHRAIKAVLKGKKYEPTDIDLSKLNTTISNAARKQAAKDRANGKQKDPKDLTIWDALGVHCSANERRADEASRDVENWLKCFYMKDRLGESFTGVISGVTPFGIFVQLDELYVEGLVHVTGLGQDYFQYDETRHELRGERTGQVYALTGRVTVQVARVDLESRKIDLVLAEEKAAEPAPLERARQAALEALEPKPPRRRKAKGKNGNGNGNGGVPASAQEAHVTPAEPAAVLPELHAGDESEDDVVFVPPTSRKRRGKAAAAPAPAAAPVAAPVAEKPVAKKAVAKKAAAKKPSAPQAADTTSASAKAPKAASKTRKKK